MNSQNDAKLVSDGAASIQRSIGMRAPSANSFLQVTKKEGFKIGNRWCHVGDVIRISPVAELKRTIMPVDNALSDDIARRLVARKVAAYHEGPATVRIIEPSRDEVMAALGIEVASMNREQRGAEKATMPRQKAGAI